MIMKWGDRYYPNPTGSLRVAVHSGDCAGLLDDQLTCDRCGLSVGFADVEMHPGPGRDPTAGESDRTDVSHNRAQPIGEITP